MIKIHTTLSTLPIYGYVKIYNSIIDENPDYRWLYNVNYKISELPEVKNKDIQYLADTYTNMQAELPKSMRNIDGLRIELKLLIIENEILYYSRIKTNNNKLIDLKNKFNLLEMQLKKIKDETKLHPTKIDIDEMAIGIETTLNINAIDIYERSTKQFFILAERASKLIEQSKTNKKH